MNICRDMGNGKPVVCVCLLELPSLAEFFDRHSCHIDHSSGRVDETGSFESKRVNAVVRVSNEPKCWKERSRTEMKTYERPRSL